MPWLILVTGHPASGKTTLADALARDLNVVVLHRDAFKESLFDTLGSGSLEESKSYGRASWALLHLAAQAVMARGLPLILEANYSITPGRAELAGFLERYGYDVMELVLDAPAAVLATRYQRRIREGLRHPGHHDDEQLMEQTLKMTEPYQPLRLGGAFRMIDTSQPTTHYYPALVDDLRALVDAGA